MQIIFAFLLQPHQPWLKKQIQYFIINTQLKCKIN